jgi:ribosomal protein L11 methylase PrmA
MPAMAAALADDGQAILSGILVTEREGVTGFLEEHGWTVQADDTEEAWWSVLVTPPGESPAGA